MSKRKDYIVRIFISSKKSLEEVEERTLDRMKFNWRKNSAVSWITQVPDSYALEDDCANAAERALEEIDRLHADVNHHDVYRMGLARAAEILRDELKKYHGE